MEEYLATIKLFAGNFTPRGYLDCDGRLLPIMQNQALFVLLGTTYGGDGRANFALPKLESPIPGCRYIICLDGVFPSRD
ncbi:phage tail protein [Oleispirillum naphthae]|uniref:phage tail protein n=1 Tax=Oleispirillum naphthae TaxID=2838853 RepID=UPI0030824A02